MDIKKEFEYLRLAFTALDTAIRSREEVEALRIELRAERDRFDRLTDFELAEARELERVKHEREILLNEKCLDCPSHRLRHLGACDHCRWKEG